MALWQMTENPRLGIWRDSRFAPCDFPDYAQESPIHPPDAFQSFSVCAFEPREFSLPSSRALRHGRFRPARNVRSLQLREQTRRARFGNDGEFYFVVARRQA